jgi:hypothetical protein
MAVVPGWESAATIDTLALARFANGDIDGAIAAQERAIARLGRPSPDYEKRLARYRGAKDGGRASAQPAAERR